MTVAAAEPKPVEKPEPKPAAAPPPPVTASEPANDAADTEKPAMPPPVTVSEADMPPAEAPAPSNDLSAPAPSSEPQSAPSPAATETANLDPVALPPDANDGSTRYGIEIGVVAKQDGLRPLWREFLTNHAALVAGLQPRRVLAPDKKWRLIAGPFANAAEATQACALFKKAVASLRADGLRRRRALVCRSHDLFVKPVPTFPDHALVPPRNRRPMSGSARSSLPAPALTTRPATST